MAENESWALLFGEQRKNSESAMICLGGDLRPPQTALELAELRGGRGHPRGSPRPEVGRSESCVTDRCVDGAREQLSPLSVRTTMRSATCTGVHRSPSAALSDVIVIPSKPRRGPGRTRRLVTRAFQEQSDLGLISASRLTKY